MESAEMEPVVVVTALVVDVGDLFSAPLDVLRVRVQNLQNPWFASPALSPMAIGGAEKRCDSSTPVASFLVEALHISLEGR